MKKRPQNSTTTARRIRIDPARPDREGIRRAARVLDRKGLLVFPTTGLYGLGADAFSPEAVAKVFACKRRPTTRPLLVLLSSVEEMGRLVRRVPDHAAPLLSVWPGNLTLVFEAAKGVPAALTGGTGNIGVRLPGHPVARRLVRAFGGPITGTSANLSGRPPASDVDHLAPEIRDGVDLVVDAGPLQGGPGSTILDVTCQPVRLLREGRIPWASLQSLLTDKAST